MRKIWARFCLMGIVIVMSFGVVSAEGRAKFEIGIDGNFATTSSQERIYYYGSYPYYDQYQTVRDRNNFNISIPERVRIAFYLSSVTAIEVTPTFALESDENDKDLALSLNLGVLANFSDVTSATSAYVIPSIGIDGLITDDRPPGKQVRVGLEFGVRMIAGDNFAGRFALYMDHAIENDRALATTTLGLRYGLSLLKISK